MASAPEAPESIVLGQFAGIRNTVSEERLALGELSAAVNVDIDDAGQLRRRRGYERVGARASYHSLRRIADRVLVVKDGMLSLVADDLVTLTDIVMVGPDPLDYTAVGETIYYSSRSASGKIVDGVRVEWGDRDSEDRWLSPVLLPTEHLGPVAGKLLGPPPMAELLGHYKGRIYLGVGRFLWYTELYLYDHVDKTRNVVQFEDDMTMIAPVETGIFVGTERELFFLQGTAASGLKRTRVSGSPVARGSMVEAPTAAIHPAARNAPIPEGTSPVFMTRDGICVGLDSGEVYNLTRGRVVFPPADRVAALYREDQGANAYVAVADSGGSPSSNARIGDYVDAEIIRASQGG